MTYQELINAFKQFAADHKQIKSWGYGQISDIEHPIDPATGQLKSRDYPYLFLNPTNHTFTQGTVTYRFNAIAMQLTDDRIDAIDFSGVDSVIKAQSDAQQILADFLAWLEYTDQIDSQVVRTTQLTPFRERFNDTVAGMTASIEIQLRNSLDLCDAPIKTYTLVFDELARTNDVTCFASITQCDRIFPTYQIPELPARYKIEWSIEWDQIALIGQDTFIDTAQDGTPTNRFLGPVAFEDKIETGKKAQFSGEFALDDIPPDDNDIFVTFGRFQDQIEVLNAFQNVTGQIKIWRID